MQKFVENTPVCPCGFNEPPLWVKATEFGASCTDLCRVAWSSPGGGHVIALQVGPFKLGLMHGHCCRRTFQRHVVGCGIQISDY